jgi:hypothetical protein
MEENLKTEAAGSRAILDRGVSYSLTKRKKITITPLKFGTVLTVCEILCEAGLNLVAVDEGEDNLPGFLSAHGDTMLRIVAVACLNEKKCLLRNRAISKRAEFLKRNLTMFQVYELFVHVINLSGMQAFTNTIRLACTMKDANLSPKTNRGS